MYISVSLLEVLVTPLAAHNHIVELVVVLLVVFSLLLLVCSLLLVGYCLLVVALVVSCPFQMLQKSQTCFNKTCFHMEYSHDTEF